MHNQGKPKTCDRVGNINHLLQIFFMNKMKLFATLSIFCLGIAAVATTQAHSKVLINGYKADTSGHCTIQVTAACSGAGSDCIDPSDNAPLFEQNNTGCLDRLAKP